MKTRYGFVSNSSSSSFIVAMGKSTSGKVTITIDVDLEQYASKKVSTDKELLDYLDYNYCWNPNGERDDWVSDIYSKAKKAIENGKTVYFGSFSDEEGGVEQMLCNEGLQNFISDGDDDIEIIHSEEGY